ncbi:MAG: hypothetical protein HXX15_21895 [Rhodopseudomonas sp.]|uniref:hypothetical protein n=1 Tax=Rhodopseudomonas sp. TaxID=1078 RepID=UPI00180BE739|nr:hypothetical protein [Rhodopseudomonas sp.]NVN88738.1 hypothetical protein [Rhodopseudomonas sp.]
MERFWHFIFLVLNYLWRVFRVLWVCRVATVSAVGGGLLIARVAQARDLFADTGLDRPQWALFYGLLLAWAWLLHAMARRALQFDDWVPDSHRPGGLSDDDRARLQARFLGIAIWIPRLLGLSIFCVVAWALWQTRLTLLPAVELKQAADAVAWILVQLIATAVVATIYAVTVLFARDVRARLTGRRKQEALLDGAQSMLLLLFHPVRNWQTLRSIFSSRLNQALLLAAVVITLLFVAAVVAPNALSDWFPRVLFLPLLLGGGLLLLGEIASLSHRYATPLLLCFFVVGGVLGYLQQNYNDVRFVPAAATSATSGTRHELTIDEAVARWKADNCRSASDCPRPIVIAGAGGASRAGFFTASVIGAMIDAGAANPALGLGDVRSRIFALSTVSGSSVGAVMMRAAWMDALERKDLGRPPCTDQQTTAWFRSEAARSPDRSAQAGSWRDCFQKLLAGDFLSPVFVGLAYRDIFPLGYRLDRSGLLEQSFERWYREITGAPVAACGTQDNSGLCRRVGHMPDRSDPKVRGDWIPLLFINGTSVATGRRIIVSDVRIGCKGQKGRLLDYAYDYRELRDPSIRVTYDDCLPVSPAPPIPGDPEGQAIDMRLSTAAMMSARFPLISTQGVIRDINGKIVDSVVDGGYFENDGLATAADIVRELRGRDLQPVVIRIVNEPDEAFDVNRRLSNPTPVDGEVESPRPPLPKSEERSVFDVYTSIGRALYATRSGHEDGHLAYLRETLKGPLVRIGVDTIDLSKPGPSQAAASLFCRSPVKKDTAMDIVSMSWWMSQPVQAYLDAQLCRPQIERLMCVLQLKAGEAHDKCDVAKPT